MYYNNNNDTWLHLKKLVSNLQNYLFCIELNKAMSLKCMQLSALCWYPLTLHYNNNCNYISKYFIIRYRT